MKSAAKHIALVLFIFILVNNLLGQAPNSFSYQALITDNTGDAVSSQQIGVLVEIIQGSASGTTVYSETHTPTTSASGTVTFEIGNGALVGSTVGGFNNINWALGSYWVKVSVDLNGGTNYTFNNSQQLLSVPYSLFAQKAGNGLNDGNANGVTPFWNGTNWITNSTNIYNEGNNVGIGTTNPGHKLDVNGSIRSNGSVFVNSPNGEFVLSNDISMEIKRNGGTGYVDFGSSPAIDYDVRLQQGNGKGLMLYNSIGQHFLGLHENGNIGFGTLNPPNKFTFYNNDPIFMLFEHAGGGTDNKKWYTQYQNDQFVNFIANDANNASSIWQRVIRNGNSIENIQFHAGGNEVMRVSSQGSVGIGTQNPSANVSLELANKPFLPPRLSNMNMLSLQNVQEGSMVYNTDFGCPYFFSKNQWKPGCKEANVNTLNPSLPNYSINSSIVSAPGSANQGVSIAVDELGNSYVLAYLNGTTTIGDTTITSNGADAYLAKFNYSGELQWVYHFDTPGFINPRSVILINNKPYCSFIFSGSISFPGMSPISSPTTTTLLVKLDEDGVPKLAFKIGSGNSIFGDYIATNENNVIGVAGKFAGNVNIGGNSLPSTGGTDVFLAQFDTLGNCAWAIKGGGTGSDEARGITIDNSGNLYIVGTFSATATFSGTSISASGGFDVFTAKYNNVGNLLWIKNGGSNTNDYGLDIAVSNTTQDVYIVGSCQNNTTFDGLNIGSSNTSPFIIKYNSAGIIQWANSVTMTSHANGRVVNIDKEGNIIFCFERGGNTINLFGTTLNLSSPVGGFGFLKVKLSPNGTFLNHKLATGSALVKDMFVSSLNDIFITGYTTGPANFGGQSHSNNGSNMFIWKSRF